MSCPVRNEWRQRQEDIVIRITRLFFKTGGRGHAWERLEALVAELDPELLNDPGLDRRKDCLVIPGGKMKKM